jgi:hypothetical protein
MATIVEIENTGASEAALQREALALARLLDRQPEIAVEHPEAGVPAPGERGGLLALGKLLVSFVAPGGVDTLIEGLKLYVTRSPEFSIAVTAESGARIEINARNLAPERVAETADRLRALLAGRA